jgi:hypothetical protein
MFQISNFGIHSLHIWCLVMMCDVLWLGLEVLSSEL